jgi:hypothetical protein
MATFLNIKLTFIEDYMLNIIDISNNFEGLDFASLCRPSLAFLACVALDDLKKNLFFGKN